MKYWKDILVYAFVFLGIAYFYMTMPWEMREECHNREGNWNFEPMVGLFGECMPASEYHCTIPEGGCEEQRIEECENNPNKWFCPKVIE